MKFSDILFIIGLALWFALGGVMLYNIDNEFVTYTFGTTVGILTIIFFAFHFQKLEDKEKENE